MNGRNVLGWTLSAVLLLLTAGSSPVRGAQFTESEEAFDADASPAANAPWFRVEVDTGDTGQHVSVALDPTYGTVYVSYYDATNQELRLARSDGRGHDCDPIGEWGCMTLDSGADVGKYSSIAMNPVTGGLGIAYHDATNGALKYVYFENPQLLVYSRATVDKGIVPVSSTGLYPSLKFSESGQPFIAYYFDNPTNVDALMLAYYSPAGIGNCGYGHAAGEWWCSTIETGEGVGQYASMAIEGDWDIHIAYYDAGSGDLAYATSLGDGDCGLYGNDWACFPISGQTSDVGRYASMYVDSASRFHIAYYDAAKKALMYAVNVGGGGNCGVLGSARCDEIDSMPADYHPLGISIAEDAAGYPVIAYQSEYGSLNMARPVAAVGLPPGGGNCGLGDLFYMWSCETIHPHGGWINYRNGDFASIAVNSSGLVTIAYNGFILSSSGNLMVAQQRMIQVFLPLVMKGH